MAAIVLGNTQVINSGSTTPIVLPVSDLPIPNVVVLDDVTLINTGGTVITSTGGIIRISDLSSGDAIYANLFYEYNDVIYRATNNHIYNGTFSVSNFTPQGARLESQVFQVTDAATSTLVLTTSPVGKILNLFVNGLEYLEDVNFTKGGSGNKTLTFVENLPWDTDYSPTYVEVNVIPDDSVSWGLGGGGGGTSDHSSLTNLAYATSGHTGFEPAKGTDDNFVTDAQLLVIQNTSGTNTGDQDLSGYSLTSHNHTGIYAPALGLDDNYVTDAEKTALHSHSNKIALDNVSGTNTGDQTLPVKAINTELNTGTDDAKFATSLALEGSRYNVEAICIAIDAATADATAGTKYISELPFAFTVSSLKLTVGTAPTGSTLFTVDVKKNGTSIFSTKITLDATETTSATAATPYVLVNSPTVFAANDVITILIDTVGSTVSGKNPILFLIGKKS
jgi:hypothetical protein